jgi:hypothetical protein
MEELFNVALVIMCGFINPKLSNLKMKLKLKSSPKSNDDILENKKDDYTNEKLSKTDETKILKSLLTPNPLLMN